MEINQKIVEIRKKKDNKTNTQAISAAIRKRIEIRTKIKLRNKIHEKENRSEKK